MLMKGAKRFSPIIKWMRIGIPSVIRNAQWGKSYKNNNSTFKKIFHLPCNLLLPSFHSWKREYDELNELILNKIEKKIVTKQFDSLLNIV